MLVLGFSFFVGLGANSLSFEVERSSGHDSVGSDSVRSLRLGARFEILMSSSDDDDVPRGFLPFFSAFGSSTFGLIL